MPSPAKTSKWGQRPSRNIVQTPSVPDALEAFVNPEEIKAATKRLNLNIPAGLHARMKAQCALAGRDMTEALIELLQERFPEGK
jgi:hypothetical protein